MRKIFTPVYHQVNRCGIAEDVFFVCRYCEISAFELKKVRNMLGMKLKHGSCVEKHHDSYRGEVELTTYGLVVTSYDSHLA